MRMRSDRGFTLVETMVAVGISGMVFGMLGFMTWFSARSAVNIHRQSITQVQASTASENITALLRNAVGYSLCETDTGTDPITRIYAEFPDTPTATTTHTLALATGENGSDEIHYYKQKITSWDDGRPSTVDPPDRRFRVETFNMTYQNSYRLEVHVGFQYKAFALVFDNPGIPQYGDFVTEAIAKNHFMGEGVDNYAVETTGSVASY